MSERTRDERIESYYHQSAWDLAERVVDLEDALAESDRLRDLLRVEHERANAAIRREDVAATHAEELGWELARETERADINCDVAAEWAERCARFESAWKSARRRAADEANLGMEALELKEAEIQRLKAQLEALRKSTDGAPRLECVGTEEDGSTVWRAAGSSDVVLPSVRRGLTY